MKKVLLIEDRFKRQEMFQEELDIILETYNDILDNAVYDRYEEVDSLLRNNEFDFTAYDIIIAHKSAFNDDNSAVTTYMERKCKELSIPLVYFSGGIDANYYQKEDGFELFEVNSKTLYSANLVLFLKTCRDDVLKPAIMLYGEQWDINILCNMLHKLNMYIEKELLGESLPEHAFYNKNPYLEKILFKMQDIECYRPVSVDNRIGRDEMKKTYKSMQNCIEKRLSYE